MAAHSHTEISRSSLIVTETHVNTALLVLGRVLFGGYFLVQGFDHLTQTAMLASAAASRGVPMPGPAVLGTGCLLVLGGLSILTGVVPRIGALLLAIFLIGVTPVMHAFWADPTPEMRAFDVANFGKNLALLGATASLASLPEPWPSAFRW